jgi:hypothetical protein
LDNLTRAHHYRDEAENLRKLAERDDHQETRESLLSVARTYDRLYAKYLALAHPSTKPSSASGKQSGQ